ncbi:MotA/TolQ/ExbB proton channel family protein [Gaetbulibacter saemankumensis]|uniref:MotA/TolQ/ExbB proton channel family protein n=1 Tax=Gaetbulibacter saemankumensis TaxID=311208 RepID=UPI0003F84E6E|nr:MotA/TolQ/ExbB proton channel family protein [Gaetbulibacter saemankumensis]
MLNLFYEGGTLFMTILTFLLLAVIICFVKYPNWTKDMGIMTLSFGILGQIIGLYSAFKGIEQMGQVSQAMMAGGLKVSSITTIYGLLIYILSIILSLINKYKLS